MNSKKRIFRSVIAAIVAFLVVDVIVFGYLYSPGESTVIADFLAIACVIAAPILVGIYTNKKIKYDQAHPKAISEEKRAKMEALEEGKRERARATEEMRREREERKAAKTRERNLANQEKQRKEGAKMEYGVLTLVGGLGDLPQGSTCNVSYNSIRLKFSASGQDFVLDASKLIDVSVMTQTEIQKQYVSSIGGAVAGAYLLGPIGAVIGGRATKKNISQKNEYLVITYATDGDTKYIVFDVTNHPFVASGIQKKYKHLKKNENVRVEL